MAAITVCSDCGAPKNKVSHCFHCFPIYLLWSVGPDAMILVFWMLSFPPAFSLSSFPFIKRLFCSSLLSAVSVMSLHIWGYWYFSQQSWFQLIISSSQAFCMMYSFTNLEPIRCTVSGFNCCFLTCIQVSQEAGQVVWYSQSLEEFSTVYCDPTVKGFSFVNEAEVDVFFWNSLAFSLIQQMLAIWSLVPLPFLNIAWTPGSSQFMYSWSLAWRILSFTLLVCEMRAIVW